MDQPEWPVLVIVDMQDYYLRRGLSHAENLIDSGRVIQEEWNSITDVIVDQIAIAKSNNNPIIILEYDGCGDTISAILAAVGSYRLSCQIEKNRDSGASKVKDALGIIQRRTSIASQARLMPSEFLVTGVNRSFCVADTAKGLSRLYPTAVITLLEDGIGDEHGDQGWSEVQNLTNCRISNSAALVD